MITENHRHGQIGTQSCAKVSKRFIIEQSDDEFYSSTSGIALVGLALNRFTNMGSCLSKAAPLAQGKSDFTVVEQHREDDFFHKALGSSQVPSEAILRQRMDEHGEAFERVIAWSIIEFLMRTESPLTPLSTGHIALDLDGFAMGNSDTKKEGVSRTYRPTLTP